MVFVEHDTNKVPQEASPLRLCQAPKPRGKAPRRATQEPRNVSRFWCKKTGQNASNLWKSMKMLMIHKIANINLPSFGKFKHVFSHQPGVKQVKLLVALICRDPYSGGARRAIFTGQPWVWTAVVKQEKHGETASGCSQLHIWILRKW